MNNDNQKDVQIPTTPKDDATVLITESPEIKRELDDDDCASVAAGYMVVGHTPPPTSPGHFTPQ
jgi:hypothetical protein